MKKTVQQLVKDSNSRRVLLWAGAPIAATVAAIALLVIVPEAALGRWSVAGALAALPAVALLTLVLTVKWMRRHGPSAPQAKPTEAPAQVTDAFGRSLGQALGAAHMRDLRAQVDLLCAMATVERMGPALTQDLRNSGASTLAHQAAVSAQLVEQILGASNLADQLARNRIHMDHPAVSQLQQDLQAISQALSKLGDRLRGDESTLPPLWRESPARDQVIANLEPIDQLLIQSTLLLSAVSDLARILATSYGRAKDEVTRLVSKTAEALERQLNESAAENGTDIPPSKLN